MTKGEAGTVYSRLWELAQHLQGLPDEVVEEALATIEAEAKRKQRLLERNRAHPQGNRAQRRAQNRR